MLTPSPSKKLSTFDFPWSANVPSEQEGSDQSICPEDINPPIFTDHKIGICVAENTWMVLSKDLDVQGIAMKLLQDSWCILKQLRLENWVEQVLETSSATVAVFQSYHENLCFSLFDFLRRFPLEAKKYRSALETIRPNDFFLHQTLMHAFKLFEAGGQYEKLNLDTNLITGPLQTLFSQADKNVLCKLKILDVRYKRYQMASDMAQGRDFDVGTTFLDSILDDTARSMATQLSLNVLRQFRCLSLESILTHDQNIQLLGAQWSDLCHNAEEIASAGVLQEKVMAVAKELFQMRNYFSLFAILIGMSTASIRLEPTLARLVDSTANFRSYRTCWHAETSIPFLYPFIIDLRRGNSQALKKIFSFVDYDLRHI